ncbi:MAG: general secretion pathway protein A [Halieaceae bacterium]|jgi:general secretion pathway protein A
MYHSYFGLEEEPFSIAVNPRFLYMSPRHRDALAHLLYGVGAGGGFILLTGEVGTGKTTIYRCLLEQLPAETDIAIILNPTLSSAQLLATICDELEIEYEAETLNLKLLTDSLHQFLVQNHTRGRNTVLLIDEAQHLGFDALEQVRLLTNLETNTRKLLQIVLVGQPELSVTLARPELRQLSQRITARYSLAPLTLTETRAYIRHRLEVAGMPASRELFSFPVVRLVHRVTRGIPRLINVVCDRSLLGTYGQNRSQIDKAMIKQAAKEVLGSEPTNNASKHLNRVLSALLAAVLICAGYLFIERGSPLHTANQERELPPETTAAMEYSPPTLVVSIPAPIQPPEPATDRLSDAIFDDRDTALNALLSPSTVGLPITGICESSGETGIRCEDLQLRSWDELRTLNRLAILELLTPERFVEYIGIRGLRGPNAVLTTEDDSIEIPLSEIGPLWTGKATYLWQPPASFVAPISLGDRSRLVFWLAEQFMQLDNADYRLADLEFNDALRRRVVLFQQEHNLKADGVVGPKTLQRLMESSGAPLALETGS